MDFNDRRVPSMSEVFVDRDKANWDTHSPDYHPSNVSVVQFISQYHGRPVYGVRDWNGTSCSPSSEDRSEIEHHLRKRKAVIKAALTRRRK